MDPNVHDLTRVMTPPRQGGEEVDWVHIEREFHIPFPRDFRDFVRIFGAGSLDDYLAILAPVPGNNYIDLIQSSRNFLETLNGVREALPAEMIYPLESRVGGLVKWAGNEDGDLCFWIASGVDPNAWKVAVYSRTFNDWTEYDCGFAAFLVRIVTREIDSPFARSDFPSSSPSFKSWRQEFEEFLGE